MTVHLDWQQDLEEDGWPRRQHDIPPRRSPPQLRWLVLVVVAVIVGCAIAFWQLSSTGLRSAKNDLQEAVTYSHWTLQQSNQSLFQDTLDPTAPSWQNALLEDWDTLQASAQGVDPPLVESLQLQGDMAEAFVRWQDGVTGQSYLSRRWFRLVNGQWHWTRPHDQAWGSRRTETQPHVTLHFSTGEGEIVSPVLTELDSFVAAQCDRYHVKGDDCHLHVAWELLDIEGRPLAWRDLALPPLAAATADEMDGSLYIMGASHTDWGSPLIRRRLSSFYPGQSYVAQSQLDILRPADFARLPSALPGEASAPIQLPSPWLLGLNNGQPHPRWQAHSQRLLADAILRRAEGTVIGSARFSNAVWALHQALLALDHGLPALDRLAEPGAAAPSKVSPGEIPDLSSLGAALQSRPNDLALRQLEDLLAFLQAHWEVEELLNLASAIGAHAYTGPLLEEALGVDEDTFLAQWRSEQLRRAASPLANLVTLLEQHMREEAEAWSLGNEAQALESYTPTGQAWRRQQVIGDRSPCPAIGDFTGPLL